MIPFPGALLLLVISGVFFRYVRVPRNWIIPVFIGAYLLMWLLIVPSEVGTLGPQGSQVVNVVEFLSFAVGAIVGRAFPAKRAIKLK